MQNENARVEAIQAQSWMGRSKQREKVNPHHQPASQLRWSGSWAMSPKRLSNGGAHVGGPLDLFLSVHSPLQVWMCSFLVMITVTASLETSCSKRSKKQARGSEDCLVKSARTFTVLFCFFLLELLNSRLGFKEPCCVTHWHSAEKVGGRGQLGPISSLCLASRFAHEPNKIAPISEHGFLPAKVTIIFISTRYPFKKSSNRETNVTTWNFWVLHQSDYNGSIRMSV